MKANKPSDFLELYSRMVEGPTGTFAIMREGKDIQSPE
jgi:hypothetical protein